MVYGDLSAQESRPIEIKPFFHYWPGSTALTFSTWSCNFRCAWCQNHHMSRRIPAPRKASFTSPRELVDRAHRWGDRGVCASFQEPTLLTEFALDVFRLATSEGLYCCYVSNGYMTPETLDVLSKAGLTGLKIDMKGDAETYRRYCGGVDLDKVWRNVRLAKAMGLHIEVVNLVVTGVNDSEACLTEVIERHLEEAGSDVPLHFTRYHPAHRLKNPSTKVSTLEEAYQWAKGMGVRFPYMGNVHGHPYEDTYCPECGHRVIKRLGYAVLQYKLDRLHRCPRCRAVIPIYGQPPRAS